MLISQFDKFVNRSTQEILGSKIERENLEPMLSTDIPRSAGDVTGVKGEKEVYYRTGNVNLTSDDIGALNEDNVYNGLDQTDSGYALDARQGKALKDTIDDKLDKANVYNGLDKTDAGYALDARQGKALNEAIGDKLDKANVYNGLDKTEAGYALDARQGKTLNDKITSLHFYTDTKTVTFDSNNIAYTDIPINDVLICVRDTTDWDTYIPFGNNSISKWGVNNITSKGTNIRTLVCYALRN